jgi:hypothetical protein
MFKNVVKQLEIGYLRWWFKNRMGDSTGAMAMNLSWRGSVSTSASSHTVLGAIPIIVHLLCFHFAIAGFGRYSLRLSLVVVKVRFIV